MIREKRNKEKFEFFKERKKISMLILVGMGCLIGYVGFFLYAMEEYNSHAYNLDPPDPDTFVDANYSRLYSMAMWYEENIRTYHMPHNMVVNTIFNDTGSPYLNLSHPEQYAVTYDSPEWTGHYLMAEAFRYAVHQDEGRNNETQDARDNILYALKGVDKILHMDDVGGMIRYAWPKDEYEDATGKDLDDVEDKNAPAYAWDDDEDHHFIGRWNHSNWVYEDDTSRDMHNGIIMGLGFVYLLVEDDDEIRDYVKELVDDMLTELMATGWIYIKPNRDPNGTDLGPGFWITGTSGIWTLAYLKVGALVKPSKYKTIYEQCAVDQNYLHRSAFPFLSRTNVVQAYYGLLLDWELLFILTMLEDNSRYRRIYMDYSAQMYDYTKYDRNAIFNAMWLSMNKVTIDNADKKEEVIIGDIEDCLMRYYGSRQRLPGRTINIENEEVIDPISVKWVNFFTTGIGAYLYPFWQDVYQFEIVSKEALTPDDRPQTDFLWSRPPYWFEAKDQDAKQEGPGVDFTAVYWMCRYYDLIEEPSVFNASIEVVYKGA